MCRDVPSCGLFTRCYTLRLIQTTHLPRDRLIQLAAKTAFMVKTNVHFWLIWSCQDTTEKRTVTLNDLDHALFRLWKKLLNTLELVLTLQSWRNTFWRSKAPDDISRWNRPFWAFEREDRLNMQNYTNKLECYKKQHVFSHERHCYMVKQSNYKCINKCG